jgi:hypothetical protein
LLPTVVAQEDIDSIVVEERTSTTMEECNLLLVCCGTLHREKVREGEREREK